MKRSASVVCALTWAACGGSSGGGLDGGATFDAGPDEQCLAAPTSLLVRTGDPAPGAGDGAVFGSVGITPVVGPEGTVAFTGYVGDSPQLADRHGLFYWNGGSTIETVAVAGQALPGGEMPLAVLGAPTIARDQVVGFQLGLSGARTALLSWNAITKDLQLHAAEEQAGAGPDGEAYQTIEPFSNRRSRTAFEERLVFASSFEDDNPSPFVNIFGLWTARPGDAATPLILRRQQAEGFADGIYYSLVEPEVRTDQMQRAAAIVPLETMAGGVSSTALYRWNLASGAIELVHQVAPPTENGVATTMSHLRMNASGQVAFTESGSGYPERLVVERGGGLETVVTVGDDVPDLSATVSEIRQIALLANGRTLFVAELSIGGRALVRENDVGTLELVAYEGMAVVGMPGVEVEKLDTVHASGDLVVWRAFLTGAGINPVNDRAIMVWNGGALSVALRSGDVEGCPGLLIHEVSILSDLIPDDDIDLFGPGQGVPRALNDDGQMPFYIRYDDADETQIEGLGVLEIQ